MMQSKSPAYAILALAAATSCSAPPTYFDEEAMQVDSVIVIGAGGHETSRTTYLHDEACRDTLTVTVTNGMTSKRRTYFAPDGATVRELIIAGSDTFTLTYQPLPDGATTVTTTATLGGQPYTETAWQRTDSATRTTTTEMTADDGSQTRRATVHDAHGDKTGETTWQRATADDEWEPTGRLTYAYAGGKISAGAYAVWADSTWQELSRETYTYDAAGLLTRKEERADDVIVITTYRYDSAGNKVEEERQTDGTVTEVIKWQHADRVKTKTAYTTVCDAAGRPALAETKTVTYYSPKAAEH